MFNQGKNIFLRYLPLTFIIIIFMFLNGCASKTPKYSSDPLEKQLEEENLQQKTERLVVVIDGQGDVKLNKAYDLLQGIKSTIPPEVPYEKVFRIYGWEVKSFSEDISVLFGLQELQHQGIEDMVVTRTLPDSELTPLSLSLDSLVMELSETTGDNALVIISSGRHISKDAINSAEYLKKSLAEKICYYPVMMGDNPVGKEHLQTLAEIGKCGYLSREKDLLTTGGMTDFVRDMFFTPVESLPAETPELEKGKTDLEKMLGRDKKVSFVLNVEFEFDKAEILPGFQDELKKVAQFLKTYPQTCAKLVGHTDSTGPEDYNRKLSLQRAKSVRLYLMENFGIDGERLTAVGKGETEPVADNSSATGRQRNRRVVAVITRQAREFSSE